MNAPTVTPELKALLRRVKLGRCLDTLPERLALAQTGGLGHAEFLELVLADEVTRRETTTADRRARAAGLDPTMTLDRWDDTAKVSYDHAIWNELCSLRFIEGGHNAVIMGPVGVGKTFLATALGHAAVRRRFAVHFERCDRLLKRLRASRLDNSHEAEMRKLLRVDLLIVDDFALQPLDALDTADVYELIVERHRAAATIVTSNREPIEWLAFMADPLLAQSAIDRLQSAAHELVLDGESYRQRQKPAITDGGLDPPTTNAANITPPTLKTPTSGPMPLAKRWSHHRGERHTSSASRSTRSMLSAVDRVRHSRSVDRNDMTPPPKSGGSFANPFANLFGREWQAQVISADARDALTRQNATWQTP